MSLEARIVALAQAIAADVKALLASVTSLAGRTVLISHLGAAPARAPMSQHLGRMAFVDVVGRTSIYRHTPDSFPGDVWREYVSDTVSVLRVHGFDGVIFTIPEFTSAERTKLAGVAVGATANSTDAQLRDRSTHTGAQAVATVTGLQTALDSKVAAVAGKGLSSNDFTNEERVKLANIATQATKNATDVLLRDRSTHTGTQPISTVADLEAALARLISFAQIGARSDQVPSPHQLGALAFMDRVGVIIPAQSQSVEARAVWTEYASNSSLKICMRGDDGAVRSVTLTLA